MAVKNH